MNPKLKLILANAGLAFLAALAGGIGTGGADSLSKAVLVAASWAAFRALVGGVTVWLTELRDITDVADERL